MKIDLEHARNLCGSLAGALKELRRIYRSEHDWPLDDPVWLSAVLEAYDEEKERWEAGERRCERCGAAMPADTPPSVYGCTAGSGCADYSLPEDWMCDCKESIIRWVDEKHPHPAINRDGWFCMGCLTEFCMQND